MSSMPRQLGHVMPGLARDTVKGEGRTAAVERMRRWRGGHSREHEMGVWDIGRTRLFRAPTQPRVLDGVIATSGLCQSRASHGAVWMRRNLRARRREKGTRLWRCTQDISRRVWGTASGRLVGVSCVS